MDFISNYLAGLPEGEACALQADDSKHAGARQAENRYVPITLKRPKASRRSSYADEHCLHEEPVVQVLKTARSWGEQ